MKTGIMRCWKFKIGEGGGKDTLVWPSQPYPSELPPSRTGEAAAQKPLPLTGHMTKWCVDRCRRTGPFESVEGKVWRLTSQTTPGQSPHIDPHSLKWQAWPITLSSGGPMAAIHPTETSNKIQLAGQTSCQATHKLNSSYLDFFCCFKHEALNFQVFYINYVYKQTMA